MRAKKFSTKSDSSVTAENAARAIDANDLERVPFGSEPRASGASAAEAELPPEASSSSSTEAGAAPAIASDGSGAIALVEMALGLSVTFLATRAKLPSAAVADLRTLSEDEEQLLRIYAPQAEPFLGALGANAPKVGAIIFAGAFALIAFARLTELKERAQAMRPSKGQAARTEDEHRAAFGPAAANVPRSTVIESDGFPPPFTPTTPPRFQPPFVEPPARAIA